MSTTVDPAAQYRAKNSIFTPANLLSFIRIVMVVPAIIGMIAHLHLLVAAIFIVAFLTDLTDGMIARRMNDVSEWGKVLDPLADKIFVGLIVITMALYQMVPWWFVGAILGRDLIIVGIGVWSSRKLKAVLPSNYIGKAAALVIAVTLFLVMLGVAGVLIDVLEGLSLLLIVASLGAYGKRLWDLLQEMRRSAQAS